jgi:UDP-3-O-[3-hydroxymyristoyl] glucosamine N-acyltransferase
LAKPQLIVKNVDAALIETLNVFAPKLKAAAEGIDPTAKVGQNVKIAKGVSVGAGVVVDDGAAIGENSVIAGGCKIGENSKLGKNCRLDSNVAIYHNCTIGNNVIIQANSTVGSTGFGYSLIDGSHKLIPHNGGVVIEDFVEIGANCCVDRAKFGNTVIGAGTKIDNLVQIAHNVVIGKCCLIAAQAGISGSCKLGDGVVLAGQVGLVDNIEIGDGTMIGAQAGVMSGTEAGARLLGSPAMDIRDAMKVFGLMKRLPKLAESLKQLHKRIERLEAAKDDKK